MTKEECRQGIRTPTFEMLESRLLLSAVDASDALQVFHAQDALFAENAGQWDSSEIHFGYNKGGAQIWFADDSIDFVLTQRELKADVEKPDFLPDDYDVESTQFSLSFDGALAVAPSGADQAETIFNYHFGDEAQWVDGVNTFKTVIYEDLYAGIDLHTFSRHGQMKYEFHVAAGSDYEQIQLNYAGIEGLWIADDGSLHIQTELGEIVDEGLFVYQDIDGQRVEVAGEFELLDLDTYSFHITGEHDPDVELVIDPALSWSTYMGGDYGDDGRGIALDDFGGVYVTGETFGSLAEYTGDIFVTKLTSTGSHVWSTYMGGSSYDRGEDIVVDPSGGAIYVTGYTKSSGWASGGFDTSHNGSGDIFVAKLTSTGGHVWSTYLGGSYSDEGLSIALGNSGSLYITGRTASSGWATGGPDTSYNGGQDIFVAKLTSSGGFVWSSYMGGSDTDRAYAIVADDSGALYVTGATESSDWVSGGFDPSHNGNYDAFVVKLTSDGEQTWSTYLGGSGNDYGFDIAVGDVSGVCVTGETWSPSWVSGGYDTVLDSAPDAFVVRLEPNGDHAWSSYVGGSKADRGNAIAVGDSGVLYVAGQTESTYLGWTSGGPDISANGGYDIFLAKLTFDGDHVWSTYLGGDSHDYGHDVAANGDGAVYVTGSTSSHEWASGGYDVSFGGDWLNDGFVARIQDEWTDWHFSVTGDFNGDGLDDIASRDADGYWHVGVSTGSAFTKSSWGRWSPSVIWRDAYVGDFNGDGRDDIICRDDVNRWVVSLSSGANSFNKSVWDRWSASTYWHDTRVGDFNGDNKDDVIGRNDVGQWVVGLSNGSSFSKKVWTRWPVLGTFSSVQVGDFNGDGRDDIAGKDSLNRWFVNLATNQNRFSRAVWGRWSSATIWNDVRFGDFNGDGVTDIAGRHGDGRWLVSESTRSRFVSSYWAGWGTDLTWQAVVTGNLGGPVNGSTGLVCDDIAGFAHNGRWRAGIVVAADHFSSSEWERWSSSRTWRDIATGDFNGDGLADIIGRDDFDRWCVGLSDGSKFSSSFWGRWL